MKKNLVVLFVFVHGLVIGQLSSSDISQGAGPFNLPTLPDLPSVPGQQAIGSVEMGDLESFPELLLDIPIAEGPFEASWESIDKNYPGEPAWLREAKFGIWVHFGPQSAGESGDWYARNLYKPDRKSTRLKLQSRPHLVCRLL